MRIVQLVPEIRPGSGVEGAAYQLERALSAAGAEVERFTLAEAGGGWLRLPEGGARRHLAVALRVVWSSMVGTVRGGLERVAAADRAAWAAAARRTAEEHSWPGVAERYLCLFREVLAERSR